MGQHVRDSARRGDRDGSVWKVFWLGGSAEGSQPDERAPAVSRFADEPVDALRASIRGFTATPRLVAATVAGVSMGEVVQAVRWLGVVVGLGVAGADWLAGSGDVVYAAIVTITGVVVAGLCVPLGQVRERFAGWDRMIR